MLLQSADNFGQAAAEERRAEHKPAGLGAMLVAVAIGMLWIGGMGAYLVGYFGGTASVASQPLHVKALIGFATFAPPLLMVICAWFTS